VGWLFDSNLKEVIVIADCELSSTRASDTITISSSTLSRTRKHKNTFGKLEFRNHNNDRKQIRNKWHLTKSRPQPTKHYWKKPKTLKIQHIFCILLAPSVRKNRNLETEMNAKK